MIYYREGYLYQTARPYVISTDVAPPATIDTEFFTLYANGVLLIKQGYAWDGASYCPEWLVPPEASCPHDAFCQLMRHGLLPYEVYSAKVHGLLRDMVAVRRGRFLAGIVHKAVTLARGGQPSNNDDNPEQTDPTT